MPDYRPLSDEHTDDYYRLTSYAFQPTAGPYDPDDDLDERRQRLFSFGERRGLFDGSDLLVCCKHIEFTARVRDEWLPVVGLSAVASPPQHRRKGLIGDLLVESLAEYREREWPLSVLWPFEYGFYARYGWETCNRYVTATIEVDALSATQDSGSGEFRPVDPDEFDRLKPVFETWLDDTQLTIRRPADWWRDRVFQTYEKELFGQCWESDGKPRGYVVYTFEEGDDGRKLKVHEFAYTDQEAYLNLLRFCHNHDSQVERVTLYGPSHDGLVDVIDDRSALTVEVHAGPMVRIVDVPMAFEAVSYPSVEDASVVVAVEDDHAPWNDQAFEIVIEGGEATVTESNADPDATVGIGTLSQLFIGYLSVDRAQRVGDLHIHSPEIAVALDAIFPERKCFLSEGF